MKANKRTLLEKIYNGHFLPSEQIRPHDPEYLPTCDEAEKEFLYLCKRLSGEDMEHLNRLLDLHMNIGGMDSCACFTYGFQHGSLLMLEILESRDALSTCQ